MVGFARLLTVAAAVAFGTAAAAPLENAKRQVLNPGIHSPAPGATLTAGKTFQFDFADNNLPPGSVSHIQVDLVAEDGNLVHLGKVPFPKNSNEATATLTVPANEVANTYTLYADEYFSAKGVIHRYSEQVKVQ